jgi:hypothetical protein
MKKKVIILILSSISVLGYSQEKLNKLSVNPVQLFYLNISNFEYERGFNEGKIGVSFYYGQTGSAIRNISGNRIYSTEQNVTLKQYSKSISKSSFWYGGQLSITSANIYSNDFYYRATNIGTLGLTGKFGYQFIIKSFYLDFFGGLGYALTNDLFGDAAYAGNISETKLLLIAGIKTGIAF